MLTLPLDTEQKTKIEYIYGELRHDMELWLSCRGVSTSDAHDMIQHAVLALSEKLAHNGESYFHKGMEAYVFSVLKYMYYEHCKSLSSIKKVDNTSFLQPETQVEAEHHTDEDDRIQIIRQKLRDLDPKSYSILKMYYFDSMTLKDIATTLGYKSEDVVKTTKCRLVKRLRMMMTQ